MNDISSISSSALQAFTTSQQVTAHNMANLNTDGFKANRASFQDTGNGGVNATVSDTEDSVDISREVTNLISNKQGFKANLTVLKTADEMSRELLSIKA